MTDTPEAVPPLVYWANSLTISMDEHTRRVNEVRSDAILQVQKIGADYQRLMDKHNALHINALASRQRVAELEAEVQEQARLNGMGAERELALMAQVSRLEAERDQLRAWQQAAFAAHPNIDIDIEAITPPNADQKGQ